MFSVVMISSTTAIGNKVDATQSSTSTSPNTVELKDVITIIDKYLSQNTVKKEKITTTQEFKLKLLAQKYLDKQFSSEVLSVLDELEKEIGNAEFSYLGYIFKKSAIYFSRANNLHYSGNKNKTFEQVADFVLTKCDNKMEQWEILRELFQKSSEDINPSNIKNFDDALKFYFVLSEYFYTHDQNALFKNFFSYLSNVIYLDMNAAEMVLYPIAVLSESLGDKLTKDQKELILNEVFKYVELEGEVIDIAVRIYYYLDK